MIDIIKQKKWASISLLVILSVSFVLMILNRNHNYESQVLTEYSGNYVMGDGMFMSCGLTISPDKTFTLSRSSDTSAQKITIHGKFVIANTYLKLIPIDWDGPKLPCIVEKLTLVVWDDRKYLLPDDGDEFSKMVLTRFCDNVRDNFELKTEKMGSVFPYIGAEDLEAIKNAKQEISPKTAPTRFDGKLLCIE